jgi:hypothetical protein
MVCATFIYGLKPYNTAYTLWHASTAASLQPATPLESEAAHTAQQPTKAAWIVPSTANYADAHFSSCQLPVFNLAFNITK